MNRRPFVRTLMASVAIAAAITLAGCETDGTTTKSGKALKPLSEKMIAELEQRNMPKTSPMLVRIFKQESELEVWKQDAGGRYALLRTYPICRWSGELGPKIKQGDRQAPEGFYTITPGQMNPNSAYYLSFNLGYPNAFDRSHGRTGSHLMVHGDCSSAGCYAMTDEQIQEIYALGRESFFGGQRSFQVQAYPFKMTPTNLAKHRANPNMPFWKMLKQGNDYFEVTRLEPKVDVCEKRYVFNANATSGGFSASAACPAYEVQKDVEVAMLDKQRQDELQTAQLVSRGVPTAPVKTGADGGMHPVFLAKLGRPTPTTEDSGNRSYTPVQVGSLPAHVVPPKQTEPEVTTASTRSEPNYRVASADPSATPAKPASSGNMFSNMFSSGDSKAAPATQDKDGNVLDRMGRWIGLKGSEPQPAAAPTPTPKPKPAVVRAANANPGAIKPKPADLPAEPPKANAGAIPAQPAPKQTAAATPSSATSGTITGGTPIVPTNSFDSRFSAFR